LAPSPALSVERLSAAYGAVQVLWDVDLTVAEGAASLLLGANGAGKSTLLACIVGLKRPRTGTISAFGTPIERLAAPRRARAGIAFMSEQGIFPTLSVRENLQLAALRLRGAERAERLAQVLDTFPELAGRLGDLAGSLSGGQRKMVGIAKCLMARPRLLIMDEPSSGLAPKVVGEVVERLAALHASGLTMLIAEQNVSFLSIATDVVVLEGGRVRFAGPESAFEGDQALREAFFGLEGIQEV